jgi:hypothetical protein
MAYENKDKINSDDGQTVVAPATAGDYDPEKGTYRVAEGNGFIVDGSGALLGLDNEAVGLTGLVRQLWWRSSRA